MLVSVLVKQNAERRHCMPKGRYRVRNWPAVETGLRRRGDLTFSLDEDSRPGGKRRGVPHRAAKLGTRTRRLSWCLCCGSSSISSYAKAKRLGVSVRRLLGQTLRARNHTTLNRCARNFAGRTPKTIPNGPLHLVTDSTGLL